MPTTISPFFLMSSSMSAEATRAETRTPTAQRPAFHNADAFITCSFARGKVADADGERRRLALHPKQVIRLRDEDLAREIGFHRRAQIAGAARMIALDAIEPVAVLVAGSGQQVVDATGIGDELQDRATMIGVEGFSGSGAEFVDPNAGVHRREMLVEIGGVEGPEIRRLLAGRVGDPEKLPGVQPI